MRDRHDARQSPPKHPATEQAPPQVQQWSKCHRTFSNGASTDMHAAKDWEQGRASMHLAKRIEQAPLCNQGSGSSMSLAALVL
eukprot:1136709-Pelagomonas_calceolata.AAC.9